MIRSIKVKAFINVDTRVVNIALLSILKCKFVKINNYICYCELFVLHLQITKSSILWILLND